MSTSTVTVTTNQQTDQSILVAPENDTKITTGAEDEQFQATARGDRNGTLKLQGIPVFTEMHEKRKWMKEHMAAAFRFFGRQGYGEGISGHISMRGILLTTKVFRVNAMLTSAPSRPRLERPLLDEPLRKALLHHESIRSSPCRRRRIRS